MMLIDVSYCSQTNVYEDGLIGLFMSRDYGHISKIK